jgi:hypothetical protein
LLILIPVVFLWPVVTCRIRSRGVDDLLDAPDLKLWHRSLCILLSYIFLVGPEAFQQLAHADVQYSQMSTQAWGHAGDTLTYFYDANGSSTYKIYADVDTGGNPADIVAASPEIRYAEPAELK